MRPRPRRSRRRRTRRASARARERAGSARAARRSAGRRSTGRCRAARGRTRPGRGSDEPRGSWCEPTKLARMFRSVRRDVVFPQAEHAELAGALALAWGNHAFARPSLPFDSFVRGVALHDRGYAELDTDEIGGVPRERWLEIQRAGFGAHDDDPIVDVVASMQIRRVVGHGPVYDDMSEALPALLERAGIDEADAAAADRVTAFCDRIAFDVCFEEAAEGTVAIDDRRVAYRYDGERTVHVEPWPFGPDALDLLLVGYRAETYPRRPSRVIQLVRIEPG